MLGLLPRMAGADAVMIMHPRRPGGPAYLSIFRLCRRTGFPWSHEAGMHGSRRRDHAS